MHAYSLDLRERVVADRETGLRTAEVARKYRVSPAWVRRLMQRYRASGQVEPKRRTQYPAPRLAPYQSQLEALIAAQPAATLAELRDALGVSVGLSTVWRTQAAQWDGARLVFLDETALQTKMTRRYGRSRRGTRLVAKVPHGHWHTTTRIAALRPHQLTAPAVFDGPLDGPSFVAYIEQVLAPPSGRATVSSWTIWPAIKWPGYAKRLRRQVHTCATCPPTARTSIPSNRSLPNSKRPSGPSPRARWPTCGRRADRHSPPSRLRNVPSTSATRAIAPLQ